MNPAEDSDNLRADAFGKFQGLDGMVNGGSNGSRGNIRGMGLANLLFDFRIAVVFGPGIVNTGIKTSQTGGPGQIYESQRQPAPDYIHDTAAARGRKEKDFPVFQMKPAFSSSVIAVADQRCPRLVFM